jgi:hypothetical protein
LREKNLSTEYKDNTSCKSHYQSLCVEEPSLAHASSSTSLIIPAAVTSQSSNYEGLSADSNNNDALISSNQIPSSMAHHFIENEHLIRQVQLPATKPKLAFTDCEVRILKHVLEQDRVRIRGTINWATVFALWIFEAQKVYFEKKYNDNNTEVYHRTKEALEQKVKDLSKTKKV